MGLEVAAGPAARAGEKHRDGAGPGARAGREAAAATLQAFRTTASGMPCGAPSCGASGAWGSAALVLFSLRSGTGAVESGQQEWGAFLRLPYGCGSTIPARPNWEKKP